MAGHAFPLFREFLFKMNELMTNKIKKILKEKELSLFDIIKAIQSDVEIQEQYLSDIKESVVYILEDLVKKKIVKRTRAKFKISEASGNYFN